jgi:mRNA-degrading endonuclease RelE of RelBE toxin-antitoxin system
MPHVVFTHNTWSCDEHKLCSMLKLYTEHARTFTWLMRDPTGHVKLKRKRSAGVFAYCVEPFRLTFEVCEDRIIVYRYVHRRVQRSRRLGRPLGYRIPRTRTGYGRIPSVTYRYEISY